MLAEDAENEWVFWNDDGQRLTYEALRFQTQCLCKAAGVPYRGEHVFRHTFATNCYHKRVDVRILSRLMGHADVDITYNIYVHLYGDGFDEMYSALVPKGKEKTQTLATLRSHGRGRRTRTLNKGFGDPRVTITPCPYVLSNRIHYTGKPWFCQGVSFREGQI